MGIGPVITLILCIIMINVNAELSQKDLKDEDDVFVPTHEWQVVKKGQKIPEGLHVRINFDSGITEAKLLDNGGGESIEEYNSMLSEEKESFDTALQLQLHDVLSVRKKDLNENGVLSVRKKDFNENGVLNVQKKDLNENDPKTDTSFSSYKDNIQNIDHDVANTIFETYDGIKKFMHNLYPKTELQVLKSLLQSHKEVLNEPENEDQIVSILEDMDFLVHKIDNANDFVTLNGFEEVIYVNLNSTSTRVKKNTLKVFGSCMQNNVKVQIHALETGAIGILLKVMVLNSDFHVKSGAIFALGSLLRNFPLAQMRFVENAGINVLGDVLEKSSDIKIRIKVVTVIYDLLTEYENVFQDFKSDDYAEKMHQYNKINLNGKLQHHNWCMHLEKVLIDVVNTDKNDHDLIEKGLNALLSLNTCKLEDHNDLIQHLLLLKVQYTILSIESKDEYFEHLLGLCDKALWLLKYSIKSEL